MFRSIDRGEVGRRGSRSTEGAASPAYSLDEREVERQFKETARAYGGQEGWQRARDAGRTKLNYRQWVQVRTPAFKQWFGNWEALRAQERLDSIDSVQVRAPEEWRDLSVTELRARVKESLDEMINSGDPLRHPEIGDVAVRRQGVKKAIHSGADPAKLLLLGDLRNAFENSIFSSADTARAEEPNVDSYEKLLAPVSINGTDLVAIFTVQRMRDGRQFYNAVTLEDRQKKTPAGSPRDTPIAGERATSAFTGVSSFIRRPLDRVNPDTVSKVVDPDTGEPLVVYKGM